MIARDDFRGAIFHDFWISYWTIYGHIFCYKKFLDYVFDAFDLYFLTKIYQSTNFRIRVPCILFYVRVPYWSEFRMQSLKIECQKNSTINHRPIFSPLSANWSYAISIYGSDILVWDVGIDTLWKWLALYHFLVDTVQKFSKFIFRKNSSNLGMYLIFFNLKAFNKLFITSE